MVFAARQAAGSSRRFHPLPAATPSTFWPRAAEERYLPVQDQPRWCPPARLLTTRRTDRACRPPLSGAVSSPLDGAPHPPAMPRVAVQTESSRPSVRARQPKRSLSPSSSRSNVFTLMHGPPSLTTVLTSN